MVISKFCTPIEYGGAKIWKLLGPHLVREILIGFRFLLHIWIDHIETLPWVLIFCCQRFSPNACGARKKIVFFPWSSRHPPIDEIFEFGTPIDGDFKVWHPHIMGVPRFWKLLGPHRIRELIMGFRFLLHIWIDHIETLLWVLIFCC